MIKKSLVFLISLVTVQLIFSSEKQKWLLEMETGVVWCGYNDVQIPRSTGTRFSLTNDFNLSSKIFYRVVLTFHPAIRHQIFLLFAPLSLKGSGAINAGFNFNHTIFSEQQKVQAVYRFNSYRLTYRYLILNKPSWQLKIGFTAKIRDAEISLKTLEQTASKTNIGFVPLLHLSIFWNFSPKVGLLIEGDALAAPGGQGRAEDFFAGIKWNLSPSIFLRIGYRIVEGGADVEEVYNFALLHYTAISVSIKI